jgi:hypothetical protein
MKQVRANTDQGSKYRIFQEPLQRRKQRERDEIHRNEINTGYCTMAEKLNTKE